MFKEFLNATMVGNMKEISKLLKVKIVWNFFGANHGKNQCDSQFARLKIRLNNEILHEKVDGGRYRDSYHVFTHCQQNLQWDPDGVMSWNAHGSITKRIFSYIAESVPGFQKFKTIPDTKIYRCVVFDTIGNVYRRKGSCSCEDCMLRVKVGVKCFGMTGSWVKVSPLMKRTSRDVDETSDTEHECI